MKQPEQLLKHEGKKTTHQKPTADPQRVHSKNKHGMIM
jgi:hypothetical protein